MPTSQRPATAHPSTEPLPQCQPISNIEGLPRSGANPSRPASTHPNLYEQLRNLSPAPQPFAPPESNYWTNIMEQRVPLQHRRHRRRWEQIDRQLRSEPQPPPELLAPPESRYEYITDETSGEGTLYELPQPTMPFPDMTPYPDGIPESNESTPKPPISSTNPRTPSPDDTN